MEKYDLKCNPHQLSNLETATIPYIEFLKSKIPYFEDFEKISLLGNYGGGDCGAAAIYYALNYKNLKKISRDDVIKFRKEIANYINKNKDEVSNELKLTDKDDVRNFQFSDKLYLPNFGKIKKKTFNEIKKTGEEQYKKMIFGILKFNFLYHSLHEWQSTKKIPVYWLEDTDLNIISHAKKINIFVISCISDYAIGFLPRIGQTYNSELPTVLLYNYDNIHYETVLINDQILFSGDISKKIALSYLYNVYKMQKNSIDDIKTNKWFINENIDDLITEIDELVQNKDDLQKQLDDLLVDSSEDEDEDVDEDENEDDINEDNMSMLYMKLNETYNNLTPNQQTIVTANWKEIVNNMSSLLQHSAKQLEEGN